MGEIPEAVRSGLIVKGGGAVSNGPTLRASARRLVEKTVRHGAVVVKRQPVGSWSCDSCPTLGSGWAAMQEHYDTTYHKVFTAVEES